MKKTNELNYKDLKMVCNPDQFNFETTEELDLSTQVLVKIEVLEL